jgi:D-alanine-D-alanine ligase-like ATP-grasp enzyme
MEKHIIKDFESLKTYFRTIERPFFAVNKYPYSALVGIENFIKKFHILAFLNSKEVEIIAQKHKISLFKRGKIRRGTEGDNSPDIRSIFNQVGKDENSKTIATLKDDEIIEHLQGFKEKPVLLFYRLSEGLVKTFEEHNWTIVGSDYKVREKYDNKIDFNKMLEAINLPVPPYMILSQEDIDYSEVVKSLGEKIVIQFPISFSGSGTFIISSREDFTTTMSSERFKKQKKKNTLGKIRITKYVNRKLSPVMGVCCTKEGIVYTDLYHQIIDAPELVKKEKGTGVYCGNEWTSAKFPESIKKQAYHAAEKIGTYLQNQEDYKGYFGLDFILDDETKTLYPIEVNIRLIGSFPVFSMLQEVHKQPLIQAIQILQYLDRDDYVLDVDSLNKEMKGNLDGSYIQLYSNSSRAVYNKGELEAGIYHVGTAGNIEFSRHSYSLLDLRSKNEFLVSQGVPHRNTKYMDYKSVINVITKGSFMDMNGESTSFAKKVISFCYNSLDLNQ